MLPWIIVGYYTRESLYERRAKTLITTLDLNYVPYYIEAIDDLGDWYKNTNYKPTFLKGMLKKFPDSDIVYVDVDARLLHYPKLFDELDCDVAVHHLDRQRCWGNKGAKKEVLSGTVFLRNNETVFNLVERWEEQCKRNPKIWDQKSLEKVLAGNFYRLPGEYCKIYNKMDWIKKPIIVHYQCSRIMRRKRKRRELRGR